MTVRRAVLALVALCALLQILPAGVGSLYNETDGQYAGAAKLMAQGRSWLIPENNGAPRLVKPPLLYWMMASSFRVFGVNEFAARLPNALGVMAWVLATFAIGARLGDVRTGFTAGVVLLSVLGTATLGRIVMPEPVFCAFIAWSIYCGVRVLAGDPGRAMTRLFWTFAGLAAFTKGIHGLLYPLAIVGLSGLLVAEWRPRLRGLFDPWGIAAFLGINLPWYLLVEAKFPGWLASWISSEQIGHLAGSDAPAGGRGNVPATEFLLLHLAWFFPWSIVAMTMLFFRGAGTSPTLRALTVLLLAWAAVVVLPLLPMGQRQDYYAMAAWPAFALWVAGFRNRPLVTVVSVVMIAAICLAGLIVVLVFVPTGEGSATVAERATAWTTVLGFGPEVWSGLRWLGVGAFSIALLLSLAALAARRFYFVALAAVACVISVFGTFGYAFVAPYFSLAGAAEELNRNEFAAAPVVFEGGLDTASSLLFYTDRPLVLIDEARRDPGAVARDEFVALWRSGGALTFVVERARVADWERVLGPLPEPSAICGTLAVFSRGGD